MGYEIYLRRPGDRTLDEASLQSKIAELGGRLEGTVYRFGANSKVTPQRDSKGLLGYDLEVPFGASEKDLRETFSFAISLADAGLLAMFDPQLGRALSKGSIDEVLAAWNRASAWQVDTAGLGEDPRAFAPMPTVKPIIEPGTKRLLIIIGAVILFVWAVSQLATAFVLRQE